MSRTGKIKSQSLKGIMLFSYALLLLFTIQWLTSQYNDQQEQLKQNLAKLFTEVQQKINDSLLLNHVIDPLSASRPKSAQVSADKITLSPAALHRVLTGASNISPVEEQKLFSIDTIIFRDMFASEMRDNGWNFNSEWINSSDSGSRGRKAIFIQSTFFTRDQGVVVKDYNGYLCRKMVPQFCFAFILLSVTAFAFWMTHRSLKTQIKLGNLKDDFISNMSHELKTPIATVKVALEALSNYNFIEDKKLSCEYLGMATSEMDRLELLATRVLNTSLLESGKIYLQRESYDLKKLVEEVMLTMQPRFDKLGASASFDAAGSSFVIPIDKLHIQGVLVNLLDNSLKYGVSPVHVHITLTETGGAVKLAVTDNGPGIPEEYREKVFEKFFRVPSGNRHNTKGYGLGLSYAAQVMRQHNGAIGVNNIAEGGCMFTLSF